MCLAIRWDNPKIDNIKNAHGVPQHREHSTTFPILHEVEGVTDSYIKEVEIMYFKQFPKWAFIMYNVDYDDFHITVRNSVPFVTKEEAEKYATEFMENVDDNNKMLFTVIPIDESTCNIGRVSILYSGRPEINVNGTKTLKVDTDMPVTWSVDGDTCYFADGNSIKIQCLDSYCCIGKIITVKAEVDGVVGKCVLTVVQ